MSIEVKTTEWKEYWVSWSSDKVNCSSSVSSFEWLPFSEFHWEVSDFGKYSKAKFTSNEPTDPREFANN
jgi:hypothetical protein